MLRALPKSRSGLFWRRVFVAPVCLCAVAALHLYRVTACRQTPWKGGGFGMFSTAESEESRFLRCWKTGSSGDENDQAVVIPRYLAREETRARVAPTPQRLKRMAELLSTKEHAPVVVEAWQFRFDPETGKLVATRLDEASP